MRKIEAIAEALRDGEEPLEVRVEPRQLSHERRHRRLVEAVAHLRAEEVAHAADSSRADSPRFLSPKKRNPFQRVPAISVAIAESVLGLTLEMGDLRKKLGKPDVLGATWLDDALVVIDSSLEGNEGRYCFTLGHEVGHWQLHRPLREMDKVTFPLFSREPGAKATAAIVCRDGQT